MDIFKPNVEKPEWETKPGTQPEPVQLFWYCVGGAMLAVTFIAWLLNRNGEAWEWE